MSFIDTGRRFTYGVKATLANVAAISSPSSGDTVFCSENNRMMTFDGSFWMCNDFIKLENGSGITLVEGDVVAATTVTTFLTGTVTTTTTSGSRLVVGPIVFGNISGVGNSVVVAISGIYKIRTNAAVSAGSYALTSTTAGAARGSTIAGSGIFGIFTESIAAAGITKCFIRPKVEFF